MKRSSVKETFSGEVAFTKFISEDKDTCDRLLEAINMELGDYSVVAEDRTLDGKRADLVVREDNVVQAVIEAQDASGWLDSVHASKISYYMYEKECNTGVLICEDADEHLKGYVRYLNENTPFDIYLIYAMVFDNKHVEFTPVMRPFSMLEKKISRKNKVTENNDSGNGAPDWLTAFIDEKYNETPELFTGRGQIYLAKQKLGKSNLSVTIYPRKGGKHLVDVYHHKKMFGNEVYNKTFTNFAKEHLNRDIYKKSKVSHRIQTQDWDDALDCFKKLVNAVETNVIKGD